MQSPQPDAPSRGESQTSATNGHADVSAPAESESREVRDSAVGSLTAERVELHDSVVGAMAAQEIQARDSLIVFGAAERIEGENCRVLLSPVAAAAFAAALGLTLAIFTRLLRGRR